jgi:AcrR family transcriptional regulator
MGTVRKSRPREQRCDAARNHEALVRTATAAVHREGPRVSMATIAADAGVGIGTLYRHFPTREDLLNSLTLRSFEQVLANVQATESGARPGPPRRATDHRTWPYRWHDQPERDSTRCRRLRSDARSAPAIQPGMGRHMPPPARHLRQWPASALMASTARRHRPAGTRQMRVHGTACRPDTASGVAARESRQLGTFNTLRPGIMRSRAR